MTCVHVVDKKHWLREPGRRERSPAGRASQIVFRFREDSLAAAILGNRHQLVPLGSPMSDLDAARGLQRPLGCWAPGCAHRQHPDALPRAMPGSPSPTAAAGSWDGVDLTPFSSFFLPRRCRAGALSFFPPGRFPGPEVLTLPGAPASAGGLATCRFSGPTPEFPVQETLRWGLRICIF